MRLKIFFLAVLLAGAAGVCAAADEQKQAQGDVPPPGMEYVQITEGYRALVPKGTRFITQGAAVIPEKLTPYVARRFDEMEQRIVQLEKLLADYRSQNEQLKSEVDKLKEKQQESR